MKRFLLLYTECRTMHQYYAEGLIHLDGTVYCRGFCEEGKLFSTLNDFKNHMRDKEDVYRYRILMVDQEEGARWG